MKSVTWKRWNQPATSYTVCFYATWFWFLLHIINISPWTTNILYLRFDLKWGFVLLIFFCMFSKITFGRKLLPQIEQLHDALLSWIYPMRILIYILENKFATKLSIFVPCSHEQIQYDFSKYILENNCGHKSSMYVGTCSHEFVQHVFSKYIWD